MKYSLTNDNYQAPLVLYICRSFSLGRRTFELLGRGLSYGLVFLWRN